jgi:predicted acylesterase/phospholipase RssA
LQISVAELACLACKTELMPLSLVAPSHLPCKDKTFEEPCLFKRSVVRPLSSMLAFILLLVVSGCSSLPERNFVPETLVKSAEIDGMAGVRGWIDELPPLERFKTTEIPLMRARFDEKARLKQPLVSNMLALSGGGENGAFGAGLLVGWTDRGDRPDFDLVTGVSAGALIAPFAFLGSKYDRQMSDLFNRYGGTDIYQANIISGILGGNAVASNEPLKKLIALHIDRSVQKALAEERAKGRLLLIGTTNLDAERPVYWDIGRIAQSKSKSALDLIRSVMRASAAIPGVFPPVRIKVVADGKTFEELHVDGGPTRQVFFSPTDFRFKDLDRALGRKITRNLFIIRNGKIGPEWTPAKESVLAIGQRSLYTVTKNQALGDLTRMHAKAVADDIAYHLAVIPDSFNAPQPEPFDRAYMQALYKVGYQLGRSGYNWLRSPPGLNGGT